MSYTERLFKRHLIVKIFLAAATAVFVCRFVFTEWITDFRQAWEFLFGITPTAAHLALWPVLALAAVSFSRKAVGFGRRYARTPSTEHLLLPDKVLWFLACSALVLIVCGLVEGWSWREILRSNYSIMAVPFAFVASGILVPFLIGCFTQPATDREAVEPRQKDDSASDSFHDSPIKRPEEDSLGRGAFVDWMFQRIKEYQSQHSLVIGLDGGWGDGKTSVLNLLKRKLRRERDGIVLVDFNPWYFNDESLLVKEFFRTISLELCDRYLIPHLSQYMRSIVKLLQATTGSIGPIGLGFQLAPSTVADEILDLKNKVQNSLRSLDKKVVMIIDDLDRLTPEELRLVFKLIRLCGDFHKFIYVLSFDREVICDLLRKAEVPQPQAFLEKIIQMDVQLPEVEKKKIDGFFTDGLEGFFEEFQVHFRDRDWERFGELYHDHITHKIENLRHAKRLLDATRSKVLETKGEVNVVDVIGLEAIRLFAHPLWEDISEAPQYYVFPWDPESFVWRLKQGPDDEQGLKLARARLDATLKNVEAASRTLAQGTLQFVFPSAGDALEGRASDSDQLGPEFERQQRVAHPHYLRKYLQQGVPAGIVSDVLVSDTIDNLNGAPNLDPSSTRLLETFHNHLQNGVLEQFLWKMVIHVQSLTDRGDDVLLRGVCRYSDKFPMEDTEGHGSAMAVGRRLIYAVANKYRGSDRMQHILHGAVHWATSMYLAADLISWCTPERNPDIQSCENIDLSVLEDTYKARFKTEYVDTRKDIFEAELKGLPSILYQVQDRPLVTAYILSLLGINTRYTGKLLFMYAQKSSEPNRRSWKLSYEGLVQTFQVDSLYEHIKAYKDEAFDNDDEKWAVETFLKLHEQKTESPQASQG